MGNMTMERRASQIKVARLLDALRTTPMHSRQVSELLCITVGSAARYLRRLHANGEIHIASWVRIGKSGSLTAVYAAGYGRDAKQPEPIARKPGYWRKRYRVLKQDPEAHAVYLSKTRHRMREAYVKKTGKRRVDPLVAALFGARGNDVSHG